MSKFLDGPAADVFLSIRRAPFLLRVVCSPTGKWDALDQLDDTPAPRERIYVYARKTQPTRMHISCRPRSGSGWYESADYSILTEQPADEVMRDNALWRTWCQENGPRFFPPAPVVEDSPRQDAKYGSSVSEEGGSSV